MKTQQPIQNKLSPGHIIYNFSIPNRIKICCVQAFKKILITTKP